MFVSVSLSLAWSTFLHARLTMQLNVLTEVIYFAVMLQRKLWHWQSSSYQFHILPYSVRILCNLSGPCEHSCKLQPGTSSKLSQASLTPGLSIVDRMSQEHVYVEPIQLSAIEFFAQHSGQVLPSDLAI